MAARVIVMKKELTKLLDLTRLRRLEATLVQQSNLTQLDRLRELCHRGC